MFEDKEQSVEDLAARLFNLVCCFKSREGAAEALAAYGIYLQGEDSGEE